MTKTEKAQQIILNALYEEEIEYFYSLSEQARKEILKATEEQIEQLENNEKELAKRMGSLLLAIIYCGDLLEDPITEENVNRVYADRFKYIEEAERFFEKPESEEVFKKYGIAETYYNGEYKTESILEVAFQDSGFNISEKDSRFTEILERLWKNRKEFPSEKVMNEESKKENGIGFKEFLFCEEYIKQGKITETSKSLGIGRTTCYEYLKKEEVKEYLEKRKKEIKEESDNILQQGFRDCFEELHRLATKDYMEDRERIRAIDTYLRHYSTIIGKGTKTNDE